MQRKNKINDQIQEQQRHEAYYSANRKDWRARVRHLHDSVLDTCKSLEDVSEVEMRGKRSLSGDEAGLVAVSLDDGTNWSKNSRNTSTNSASVSIGHSSLVTSLPKPPGATYLHSSALDRPLPAGAYIKAQERGISGSGRLSSAAEC